jgi:hypothetical protein
MKMEEARQITKKFKKRRKEEGNKKELERALFLESLDPVRPQCMLYVVLKKVEAVRPQCMYVCVCMYVCMYKGWAIKFSPCTATFNVLLCLPF